MYGVQGPLGFGVRRATFLIDQARHIREEVLADFRIGRARGHFVRKAVALSASEEAARGASQRTDQIGDAQDARRAVSLAR